MAITAPRIIFACSIPTIIVILSYIWFKKKKETFSSSFSSSQSSVSLSSSGLNCVENNESVEETVEEKQNATSEDIVQTTDLAFVSIEAEEPSISNESQLSLLEETVVNCREEKEIVEMVYGTTTDKVGDRHSESSDKDTRKIDTIVKEEDVDRVLLSNGDENQHWSKAKTQESSDITENFKELRLSQCDDESNVVPDQTVADESNDDTLVEESINDETMVSKQQQHDEETSQKTHSSEEETSVRHSSRTESESDVVAIATISDHPPVVSSPGSTTDDQELQKLTNGTDTSAYGSASHSPAEELLESPTASNFSDMHSEGSSDSGKGCSEMNTISADSSSSGFPFTPLSVFEFELPQDLCGRLIGQKGRYVNFIKSKSKANISIKRHPFNTELKLCAVIGTEEDINNALILIRKRFPLTRFPCISMIQVNAPLLNNVPIPDTLQLHLPEGVTCDVIMSSLVTAGHFFVQQPTHPTYSSLGRLDQCMLHCYLTGLGAPELPKPVEPGVICSASTMGGWYRAQIVFVHPETEECEIRFVDYGGYLQTPISSLRQIRSDFMTLPFQASECYLANVVPIDETQGWTLEATSMFEELAQGQILQAQVITYSDDGIPYVHIYRIQGVMSTFINRELVDCGLAKWVDHQT